MLIRDRIKVRVVMLICIFTVSPLLDFFFYSVPINLESKKEDLKPVSWDKA